MASREQGTGNREGTAGESRQTPGSGGEQGFMLLGLIVAMAIILLFLGVAASTAAYSLRRDKELESARRADQYVRAIRLFYLKNGHYPGSIEQLENTNNVRYLRKQYVDPLTGQADYRVIVVGQNKTTVKGFFGQPLGGIATVAPGAMGGPPQTPGAPQTPVTGGSSSTPTPIGSPPEGSGLGAATGPVMGVGSSASGPSILTVNGQTSYETWEFLYDPRVEQLGAATALNAGSGTEHSLDNDPPQTPASHQ
jgi:type II secretory pathway pseudopilin PulG